MGDSPNGRWPSFWMYTAMTSPVFTLSAEAMVVPVKTVPKTTEAKVKVCLCEIVYFFKMRPLFFNKFFLC